jgi:two-component system, chemotaxis family, protein-glutamate methylesterase/glutaminase
MLSIMTTPLADAKSTDIRLRVMVVDDTKLFRLVMVKALHSIQGVEVVATAQHGKEAIEKLSNESLAVDVVFLDVEMPELNGLETLKQLRQLPHAPIAIMVSGHNKSNIAVTIEALSTGAYDFIPKPTGANATESEQELKQHMLKLLKAINFERSQVRLKQRQQATGRFTAKHDPLKATLNTPDADATHGSALQMETKAPQSARKEPVSHRSTPHQDVVKAKAIRLPQYASVYDNDTTRTEALAGRNAINNTVSAPPAQRVRDTARRLTVDAVLIGISTGGPAALTQLIPQLNPRLRVPVLIVQHMPEGFTTSLAETLNKHTPLHVTEARHNEIAHPRHVYIAPGGKHMEVVKEGDALKLVLTDAPPVNACRPSVDVLFASSAKVFRKGALAVVMTGIGRDGANGVEALHQNKNTYCITQSASTCTVYGMPKAVDDRGLSDESCPLNTLADRINELVG